LLLKSNFYSFFLDLKNELFFKFSSLLDLTALNRPDFEKEFELNYLVLSLNLNLRFLLKLFFKKEDLILSISNIYENAN
jgi:NADH-quinone oxidoreductase subunit C